MKYLLNKNKQKYLSFIFILLIILFMGFIICHNIFVKEKEGFSVNDIGNMFNDVKNVTRVVGEVPQQINNIQNKRTSLPNKNSTFGQIIMSN